MNCKQPIEKQLGASVPGIGNNTKSLEKAISPVCRIKIDVRATVVASGRCIERLQETKRLKVIESELKSTRQSSYR